MFKKFVRSFFVLSILFFSNSILFSQPNGSSAETDESPKTDVSKENETLAEKRRRFLESGQINVIGSKDDDIKKIPGSANVIGKKILKETNPIDSMEALRRVPGATIRYQDAVGLTPNIAFRGVSNEESRKTLILEDGVFTSLSPYGQPESYFIPHIDRMERVEVVKGSGSILFGPTTLGGIVNYVTRKPPEKPTFSSKVIGGMNGYASSLLQYGGTVQNTNTAYDISYMHNQGSGFRDYQGFRVNDLNLKLMQKLGEKDSVFLKYQSYQQESQSTYLGLSQGLYWKNPRINPARYDQKSIERQAAVIGHDHTFNENWKMITRAYWTNVGFLFRQESYSYNNQTEFGFAARPPENAFGVYAPDLIGNQPGDVIYMLNSTPNRHSFFRTGGLESKVEGKFNTFGLDHEIAFGARMHYETVNAANNTFPYPNMTKGLTTQQQNRNARAYALYVQDSIKLTDKFKVIPGVRYEHIFQGVYTHRRLATADDVSKGNANTVGQSILVNDANETYTKVVLPGIGLTFDITDKFIWFAGAHTAFSPPTFSTVQNPALGLGYKLSAERSNNYETGFRGNITRYFYTQISTYALYFSNQIVNTNEAGSGIGAVPINAGRSVNRGVESNFVFDFGKFAESRWEIPLEFTYSYTKAISTTYVPVGTIQNPDGTVSITNQPLYTINSAGNLIKVNTNGNYLPYVPMNTFIGAIGFKSPHGFYARVEYQYFDKQYSDLQNTKNQSTDGSQGIVPAYGIWNADFGYEAPGGRWSIFVNGKNLEDRVYISGRLPVGIQQGPYRQINIGATLKID
ncbi:TonB-dependent receptor family protein [Leptospira sarikeiensis]|uniref:TonB-dependent receptor n=1 Tax=Leptospira sarikeiensis TaxID=2484943 RepID=A0A4R9KBN1_9LEPT|nr:TonB-dependent receptor [Leptospira sarikeiensis]TGL64147.1 TonB-dependent receptor [Leptospira sarikeiensis]